MRLNLRTAGFLFIFIVISNVYAYTQSVRGKIIYVSSLQDVKLKFRSTVSNYSFVNKSQASAFKIKSSGRNLQLNSVAENMKPANIVVTEGSNTHLFILAYKSSLDASTETVYDFSSKEKLQQETQKMMAKKTAEPPVQIIEVKKTAATEPATIVTQAVVTEKAEQPSNNAAPTLPVADVASRPQATSSAEPENNKLTSVANLPAKAKEARLMMPTTYSSEIAKGTVAFKEKNYKAAKSYFQSAQKLNPVAKYPKMRIAEIDKLVRTRRKS